jgi:hypothetical protein
MAAPIEEVTHSVNFNSSNCCFDTTICSYMAPDNNYLESMSSVQYKIVFADNTQVVYTGIRSVPLSCHLLSTYICLVMLHRVLFILCLRKSLYSWNSVKSIEKFPLIIHGGLQVILKLNRSVVINTFQSANDFDLDIVQSEFASFADDTDYEFWYAAFGHIFKIHVHRNLDKDRSLIPDYPSNFNYNPSALSKFNHQVPKPREFNSIEEFQLIFHNRCEPFPNESNSVLKYFSTIIDKFPQLSWVFFLK